MTFNLNKNNIHVFPVTNKPSEKQSRLTTEYNITNIVNRLLDNKSFVITSEVTSGESALEFNIQGYYVKVDKISDLIPVANSDCYAFIKIPFNAQYFADEIDTETGEVLSEGGWECFTSYEYDSDMDFDGNYCGREADISDIAAAEDLEECFAITECVGRCKG